MDMLPAWRFDDDDNATAAEVQEADGVEAAPEATATAGGAGPGWLWCAVQAAVIVAACFTVERGWGLQFNLADLIAAFLVGAIIAARYFSKGEP